ncbi:hypothetical protein [Clostridium botulinum]|uniref:hypothetical protein n=1 Tax=Clostridium botulinum TaxID=1491 RepID=UPI001E59D84D|nr:hypothetical protein [Clostridium botulinum]MCD3223984.1 hypothetical protein [Clostridium botulinum C/D]MCD3297943.1 hypothetical protein [Clostridium botulinum C/D]
MFKLIKLSFQFLVVIQVLSVLCTGNGKVGTKITIAMLKVFQYSISTMFYVFTYVIKLTINLICNINNYRKKNTEKLKTNKCKDQIRMYNETRNNTIDIQSYIKFKGLS